MGNKMNFKKISALLDEINELTARFKRFVDSISSVEETAGNVELELSDLLKKLQHILSTNGYRFTHTGVDSDTGEASTNPNSSIAGQNDPLPGSAPVPSSLKKEMVAFHNSFRDIGNRYSDLAVRINSIDGSALNLHLVLTGIQKRLKSLIKKDSLLSKKAGLNSAAPNTGKIPEHAVIALTWSAEIGVASFTFQRLAGGGCEFEIEGKFLTLSPRLADLLIALSRDHGPSENGLVGWKSIEELEQSVLGPERGWPPKDAAEQKKYRQSIRESILRLRDSFKDAGMNRYLIQGDSRFGYRFALKRRDHSGDAVNPP